MDGHVTQESTWTAHVRAFCRGSGEPYPRLVWCRYRTDDIAKNAQSAYADGILRFPPGFSTTEEGRRYVDQTMSYGGKAAGKTDDAPDSLICAFELLHQRGLARRTGDRIAAPVTLPADLSW